MLSTKVGRLLVPARSGPVDGGIFDGVLPFEGVFDYSYDGAEPRWGTNAAARGYASCPANAITGSRTTIDPRSPTSVGRGK